MIAKDILQCVGVQNEYLLPLKLNNRNFLHQVLKSFLDTAEAEVRSLISLYSEVVSLLYHFLLGFFKTHNLLLLHSIFSLPYREETQILCHNTLERIQLGVLLNKVWNFLHMQAQERAHRQIITVYSSLSFCTSSYPAKDSMHFSLCHLVYFLCNYPFDIF